MNKAALSTEFVQQSCKLLDQSMVKINHCCKQLTEAQIWWRPPTAMGINSIGNLMLHLEGNLKQWGIVPLTGQSDQRDRESEFIADQNVKVSQLLNSLTTVVTSAKQSFMQLNEQNLMSLKTIQGFEVTVVAAIIHTTSHFVGHTHQIIQLTRLQLGDRYQFQWQPSSDRNDVPI